MTNRTMMAIDAQIEGRHLLTHPFYQAWQRGELTQAALADYATQYYAHVAMFPRYLSALHSHMENETSRRVVLENLMDEEAGQPNHPELWLQFAEGVGASRSAVKTTATEPETRALTQTLMEICRYSSVAAGLAALYSYESQIPAIAATKIDGLKQFYGITDEKSLAYFQVHQEADVAHAAAERTLLTHHLNDTDAGDAVDASARTVDALWNLLSGVCARHGIAMAA